jgi:hypothetical protein
MTGWKIFDMLKKHFGYERDEQFFHGYNDDAFPTPQRDLNKDISEIKAVNSALDHLKDAQRTLDWLVTEDEGIKDEIKRLEGYINDAATEIDNIPGVISELVDHCIKLEAWGDDWKYIASEFFQYMLEKHADEIDEVGVVRKSINENYIKSIPAVDKFKL